MTEYNNITFVKSGEAFDSKKLDDGVVVFVTCSPNSTFATSQIPEVEKKDIYFRENNCTVFFVTNEETSNNDFLYDPEDQIAGLTEELSTAKNIGINIIYFSVKDGEMEQLLIKESPDDSEDWGSVIEQFVINYNNIDPDEGLTWRWGQQVPYQAEFKCIECGHVEPYIKDKVFKVCPVCLSGEPDGPSDHSDGYWLEE